MREVGSFGAVYAGGAVANSLVQWVNWSFAIRLPQKALHQRFERAVLRTTLTFSLFQPITSRVISWIALQSGKFAIFEYFLKAMIGALIQTILTQSGYS
jgi:hypothetical protein